MNRNFIDILALAYGGDSGAAKKLGTSKGWLSQLRSGRVKPSSIAQKAIYFTAKKALDKINSDFLKAEGDFLATLDD